jgi:L-lysine 2,3-aminomutase
MMGCMTLHQSERSTDWQTILAHAIRDRRTLLDRLGLESTSAITDPALDRWPVLVPEPYLARIEPGKMDDPLLLQVLPTHQETDAEDPSGRFVSDPLGEAELLTDDGELTKYRGRSLIVTSQSCAVHCRFCFRRHFRSIMGGTKHLDGSRLEPIFKRVEADESIRELILSGGDPLALTDGQLSDILGRIGQIPHIRRVRLHSRFPVAIPQRITDDLVEILGNSNGPTRILVLHLNHPNEIDSLVESSLRRLRRSGVVLLSQSVLLRGVNDSVETLRRLFEQLTDLGVLPYYLHQLDPVAGAGHFEVPVEEGRRLIAELRASLPGYAVPRYVQELPGGDSKTVLL